MNWYLQVFKSFADFSGRSRRTEYWMFMLINSIAMILLGVLSNYSSLFAIVYYLYALIIVVPSFALTFRRLHDINKSAWWILISWIPFIGQIWFFILMITEGTLGGNNFGSDPKAA